MATRPTRLGGFLATLIHKNVSKRESMIWVYFAANFVDVCTIVHHFQCINALALEDRINARQLRFRNQYVIRTQKQTDCDLDDVISNDSIYETKGATDSMQENIQSPQLPKFLQNVLSH